MASRASSSSGVIGPPWNPGLRAVNGPAVPVPVDHRGATGCTHQPDPAVWWPLPAVPRPGQCLVASSGASARRFRRVTTDVPVDEAAGPPPEPTVLDVLHLEEIDRDLYRSTFLFPDPLPLYGGQVAAQALRA